METRTKNYIQKLLTYKLLGDSAYKYMKFYKQYFKYRIGISYELSAFMEKILNEGDVFFDVGANLGQYIFRFRDFAASSLKIFAFEPVTANYNMVKAKLGSNRNVKFENLALSDNKNETTLYIPVIDGIEIDTQASLNLENRKLYYSEFKEQKTAVTTIDEYCMENLIEKIDLLKVDTEGNDSRVIEGGRHAISEYMPVIMAEDITGTEAFAFLTGLGYKPYFADRKNELYPHDSRNQGLIKDLIIMVPVTKYDICKRFLSAG